MIYYIDGIPNPWVKAIVIVITAGYYLFYGHDAPVSQAEWIGPWGVCSEQDGRMYE